MGGQGKWNTVHQVMLAAINVPIFYPTAKSVNLKEETAEGEENWPVFLCNGS